MSFAWFCVPGLVLRTVANVKQLLQKEQKTQKHSIIVEQHTPFFQHTLNKHTSLYVIRSTQKAEIPAKAPTPLRLNPRTCINLIGSSLAHCPAFN